jgi:general L-amino acid transport system permease protein
MEQFTTIPHAETVPLVESNEAPNQKLPPGEWLKENLFSTVGNSIVTVVVGAIAVVVLIAGLDWVINADFKIVRDNLRIFMVGQFPRDELWRPWASGYVLLLGLGLTSGALAHNAYDTAIIQDLPAVKESLLSLVRRFWAIIAVLVFFVSFARTLPPYIGLAAAVLLIVAAREIGWRMPTSIRARSVFIGAALFIISMLILAGTSNLGGLTLGAVAFAWALSEVGRRDLPSGIIGLGIRGGVALAAGVIVFFIQKAIPHDGFGWEDWGGLHISLFTTVLGITLGMPFGILLALGRKSNLPVLKTASVIYIEFITKGQTTGRGIFNATAEPGIAGLIGSPLCIAVLRVVNTAQVDQLFESKVLFVS